MATISEIIKPIADTIKKFSKELSLASPADKFP
jgi:hypothetical protein